MLSINREYKRVVGSRPESATRIAGESLGKALERPSQLSPAPMLSSKERLAQKTGRHGLGRFEYLQALVTEFQDTHRQGLQ